MIVHTLSELTSTDQHVIGDTWTSTRLIVKSDGMGYSVHHTVVRRGAEIPCEYKDHLETNYCIAGEGEVVDVASGRIYPLKPGTIYALDRHDRHVLRAIGSDLHLVCVFNPPLSANEVPNAALQAS